MFNSMAENRRFEHSLKQMDMGKLLSLISRLQDKSPNETEKINAIHEEMDSRDKTVFKND